ncbi:MAG: cyclic nucleotide-binding domain-containing protein [Deltaproteobacteria bacterium]|nr:cyclic nucleotide-binding domain-containing protein [Deltaproteobacteria bacterium]
MIDLFVGLNVPQRDGLARLMRHEQHKADVIVIRAGDPGETLYFVEDGAVAVTTRGENGKMELLNLLSHGDCFGEMALLNVEPYSATVTTVEPTTLTAITHEALRQFVDADPSAGREIYRTFALTLSERLRQLTARVDLWLARGKHAEPVLTGETATFAANELRSATILLKGMTDLLLVRDLPKERVAFFLKTMQAQAEHVATAIRSLQPG